MCKYCIFTMDWTPRISYVHIGQYYYYYYVFKSLTLFWISGFGEGMRSTECHFKLCFRCK